MGRNVLKTDYKNYIPDTSGRKFKITAISGTANSKIEETTTWEQEGDNFGGTDINSTNAEVNALNVFKAGTETSKFGGVVKLDQYDATKIDSDNIYTDGICAWTKVGTNIVQVYGIPNTAYAHNGVFRGRDITDIYTSGALHTQVEAGDFTGIYVGDYFTVSTTYGGTAYDMKYMIAGFDLVSYSTTGKGFLANEHRLLMINYSIVKKEQMNASNTTSGGYHSSRMKKTIMAAWQTSVINALGSDHLRQFKTLESTSLNTSYVASFALESGRASAWEWFDTTISIQGEENVYGAHVHGGPFGVSNFKFPLYNFIEPNLCDEALNPLKADWGDKCDVWLGNVNSSSGFALVNCSGRESASVASVNFGVRFYFLWH